MTLEMTSFLVNCNLRCLRLISDIVLLLVLFAV